MTTAYLQSQLAFSVGSTSGTTSGASRSRLALVLDDRAWLELLADEWWPLGRSTPGVRLGVGAPRGDAGADRRVSVVAWIDPKKLPAIEVLRRRDHAWARSIGTGVLDADEELVWPGPLPLFAVTSFSVAHEADRARLLAMAEGFANVGRPEQAIEVEPLVLRPSMSDAPSASSTLAPSASWNAMRGAAAMAVWAVPAVCPWMEVLCGALALRDAGSAARSVGAPWWHEPPWRPVQNPAEGIDDLQVLLSRAAVDVLQTIRLRDAWRPMVVLEAIRRRMKVQHTTDQARLDDFVAETRALLHDERSVNTDRGTHDPVGLALQLLLLRPVPERFVTWAHDLRALPPGVWWTGATLSGLLQGYRDLPLRFRGAQEGRRRLALRLWQIERQSTESAAPWPGTTDAAPTWQREGGKAVLLWDGERWGERAENTRGRWFYADLRDTKTRDAAINLVTHARPACLREEVRLVDSRVPRAGAGTLRVDDPRHVIVEGEVVLKLPFGTSKTTVLDDEAFHAWLALDAIGERLPEPPGQARQPAPGPSGPRSPEPRPAEPAGTTAPAVEVRPEPPARVPPGLVQVYDFVSEAEERELLATIDAAPWNGDFARRVQHYGWTYNYKARKVDPGAYLGPLPEWAERLARRLFEQGHVRERLDQVIVNEYRVNQGITKHVDCLPCFRGAIVTVSLGESWEMFFWPPVGKQKLVYMLERRSAVVLSGDAREKWKHEIPKRMNEPWGPRGRRISLTFRTVNVPRR